VLPTYIHLIISFYPRCLKPNEIFIIKIHNITYLTFAFNSLPQVFGLVGRMPYSEEIEVEVTFKAISITTPCPFLTVLVRRGFELLGFERHGDGLYDTVIDLPEVM